MKDCSVDDILRALPPNATLYDLQNMLDSVRGDESLQGSLPDRPPEGYTSHLNGAVLIRTAAKGSMPALSLQQRSTFYHRALLSLFLALLLENLFHALQVVVASVLRRLLARET